MCFRVYFYVIFSMCAFVHNCSLEKKKSWHVIRNPYVIPEPSNPGAFFFPAKGNLYPSYDSPEYAKNLSVLSEHYTV